jgi:hypothetical protein
MSRDVPDAGKQTRRPRTVRVLTAFEQTKPARDPMADRDTKQDNNASSGSAPQRGDDRTVPPDPDVGQQNDPNAEKSTASRPRGQTEEADRTL